MKRSIMGLMYLIQGMQSVGVDVYARLKEIGIDSQQLNPQALIHRELEWHIQQHIGQDLDPFLGLLIGQQYALAGYGPFLMFLMTAKSVDEAFREGIQYDRLTYVFGKLSYCVEQNRLGLIYQPVNLKNLDFQLRTNAEISGTYRFIRDIYQMMGLPVMDIQVELPISIPEDQEQLIAYQMYYGANVQFGFEQARFWVDASILRHQLATADPIMHEVYRQRCDEEVARMSEKSDEQSDLIVQIQDYLLLQSESIPSLSAIAKALHIPERTLRHQLSLQQTSFQKIREQVLQQRAKQLLLEHKYTIEEIAIVLGYAETASFNHAFKRWYGISPKQFLRESI